MKCQTCEGRGGWEQDDGWGDSPYWADCADCNGTGDDGCEERYKTSTHVGELVDLHRRISEALPSERKLNLLSLALLRQTWRALEVPFSKELICRAELVIEGEMSNEELLSLRRDLMSPKFNLEFDRAVWWWARGGPALQGLQYICTRIHPHPGQSKLFRDIFPNPLNEELKQVQPEDVKMWLAWEYGLIPRLAEDTYNNREEDYRCCGCGCYPGKEHPECPKPKAEVGWGRLDKQRLKILSDALEECGCRFPSMLEHLRQDTLHVRGCWVIDLLLGRT
jgi:hypothetical protein